MIQTTVAAKVPDEFIKRIISDLATFTRNGARDSRDSLIHTDRWEKVTTKSIRLKKFGPGCARARWSTAVLDPRRQFCTPP